ncbi:hypothetical protein ERJ75_000676800 [Trypanosoma vivax]|nr:syntaxin [Trypanosoma vivax]KAH8614548.1 hypothetical protein ERJ75_000676800 [Trypanosoma vivax]
MTSLQDPFEDSVNDVQELIAKAKCVQHTIQVKGPTGRDGIKELGHLLDAANEELSLLNEALQVIEQRNGKVGEEVFSVNEVVRRQRIVRDLESDLREIQKFWRLSEEQIRGQDSRNRDHLSATMGANDAFILRQEHIQREEIEKQDVILDRLQYGIQELKETGVHVNDELQQQDALLGQVHNDMNSVQQRLLAVNAKVDELLTSMSKENKVCVLVFLSIMVVVLLYLQMS